MRRYRRGRLYDVRSRRYVNMTDLRALADAGEALVVLNAYTGADLTAATLGRLPDGEGA